jgi:hypothetical protein
LATLLRPSPKKAKTDLIQRLVAVLPHGEQIGESLGGVELVGQPVPDRNTGIAGQLLHLGLLEAAVLDAVVHPPEHARGVADRLLLAELRSGRVEIGHMGALFVGSRLEGAARAGGGLFENERDLPALQPPNLAPGMPGLLELRREIQQELDFRRGEVQQL